MVRIRSSSILSSSININSRRDVLHNAAVQNLQMMFFPTVFRAPLLVVQRNKKARRNTGKYKPSLNVVVLPITTVGVLSICIGIDIGKPKPKRVVPDHRVSLTIVLSIAPLSLVEPTCCFRSSHTITSLHEHKPGDRPQPQQQQQ